MPIKYMITLLLLSCFACQIDKAGNPDAAEQETEIPFDRTKWSIKEGPNYPYRPQMLHDIVYNDTIRALRKDELTALLGEPDRTNENFLYYPIAQKRLELWPLSTRTMVIKLSEDGAVDWIKIHNDGYHPPCPPSRGVGAC